MAKQILARYTVIIVSVILFTQASALTDLYDVMALENMFISLNKTPQLKGWRSDGGDPCQELWTGVSCAGSSLLYLKLQGLNLSGTLGTQLHYLHNLKHLDVSSNNLIGEIPYGLPPNVTHINLAHNKFSQNIPHSLSNLKALRHLNLSHNLLSGPIGNVFTGLKNLKEMDLSYNEFTGDLPPSFETLKNLSRLFLQNNQFTGSVVYLSQLSLIDLNIQSNHFSGVIPIQFQSIPNLWIDGNNFHIAVNYPPWNFPPNVSIAKNFSGPPVTESSAIGKYPNTKAAAQKKKKLGPGGIACTVGAVTLAVTCAAIFIVMRVKRIHDYPGTRTREDSSAAFDASPQLLPIKSPPILALSHAPFTRQTRTEKMSRRKSFVKKYQAPASAKIYTVAELRSATNSFSEENLLGKGSLGSVYKAEFPDGQVSAVRNISMVSLSFQEEEQFLDVIWTASRLRHPNIVTLLGYCVEHGQHLLVYEYIKSCTLDDVLHGEAYKPLPWTTRLNISLGIARSLDYLHSTFSPPITHGNIKAANILLDEEFKPRLCDCGISILRPLTSNSIKLKASEIAIGDTGYIAPEHGEPGTDNTKTDIYAYGVLLLELLTGRRPFDSSRSRDEQSLVKWASSRLHDSAYLSQMVDPSIRRSLSPKVLSRFADVVSLCIQPEMLFRPPMSEIIESLSPLLQKFTYARTSGIDIVEAEPTDKSYHTTPSCMISSPTVSFKST
ncbi:protein STRUBBELIG-RECEPTOR FAMILY 2 isoform X1 [Euphorbia lathyris]|uniref:protein STRUBBELIG-RECEPTOR FAMILY 2 isoform X1 n=1 Tax=Euphorbia lathyris TaxID=212925 RepID=UPI0033143969